jgi:uncharacterized protein YwqG
LSGAEQLPEHYLELADALEREDYPEGSGLHRFLGYSANIQGDMQREAQLVSSGIYCGAPSDDPRIPELEQAADDWLLLLQLDSEDAPGIMWGDTGMLYFWIRKTDLAARRFDCVWMTLQCG